MQRVADPNAKLNAHIESWRSRLLDIGNRNPLINTSFIPTRGVLDLMHPQPEEIWRKLIISGEAGSRTMPFPWKRALVPSPETAKPAESGELDIDADINAEPKPEPKPEPETKTKDWNPPISECLASRKLAVDDLLTPLGDRAVDRRIRTLNGHAQLSMSEQGIHSLFLVFGFIKWFESADSSKEIRSPLILVPAAFSRETADSPWELLEAEDDVVDNLCLRQRFKQDFGLELPPLPELDQLEEDGARLAYLEEVRRAISKNERWEVEERCCLGRFAFPKIAMWQDLGDHIESIAASAICKTIGGQVDSDPQIAFGDPSSVPAAQQLDDTIGPGEIKAILDCDSSQLEAIVAARKGVSFVLDGPPGTGKSQTIANIIADALSVGKRVLFVSEKVAALEVVKRRLDDCGLGDFCLECHSSKANRKAVLEDLRWCLEIPTETYPDPHAKLADLHKQRQALNDYVRILHQPQQPIGMSMYELHGQIARLTRLGMLGRSRIEFSEPETISSSELGNWLQLLQLATQHRNVLSHYANHPWQGCRLTSQTLSLKSEIQHNFTLLADLAEQFAGNLAPLEEAKLVPTGTTPIQIPSLIAAMETSLTTPNIPTAWFAAPREIANSLLERHRSYRSIFEKQNLLAEYNDEAINLFCDDVVSLSDLRNCRWLERLTNTLPSSFEERRKTLASYSQSLRTFDVLLGVFETNLKQLIAELKLPIKADLPMGGVGKLLQAARLVCDAAPFRMSWFDPETASRLVASSQEAVAHLEKIDALESNFRDRIEPDQLLKLADEVPDIVELQRSWALMRLKVPITVIENLDYYPDRLRLETERLNRIQADLTSLSASLQWNDSFAPTLEEARSLIKALPVLLDAGAYHGSWVDSSTRKRVKLHVEAVLLDLSEAQELRKELETRLSHRAFLSTSRPLIERGQRFTSWWSRWLGGYAKYRNEIANLYRVTVPNPQAMLNDVLQLATFHRRLAEVESVYGELKDILLVGLVVDEAESWQRNLQAMMAFESFITAAPQVASALPPVAVSLTMRPNDPISSRLAQQLEQTSAAEADTQVLETLDILNMPIKNALTSLSQIQSAILCCTAASRSAQQRYKISPDGVEQLISDFASAKAYAQHRDLLESLFAELSDDLPLGASAYERDGWAAAIRGADSADKLVKTFGSASVLKETVCTPGQVNPDAISTSVAGTESALQMVGRMWSEQITFITLIQPGQPSIEPKRRVVAELRECVVEAASEYQITSNRLSKLLSVLRPGLSVPLERLPQDAETIQAIRLAQKQMETCSATLASHHLEYSIELSDEEVQSGQWIMQAPSDLLKSPLSAAVATCQERRIQVGEILSKAKLIMEQMSEPGKFLGKIFPPNQTVSSSFIPRDVELCELPAILRNLISATESLDEWISFNRWRQQMTETNFGVVVEELLNDVYSPAEAADAVCAKLYQQRIDYFVSNLPHLADFDGVRHEQIREQYRQLDEWEIKAASARVREFQLSREDRPRVGWLAPMTSELGILKRETEKKRRHMPLRKLFNAVPGVLQRLKPCIMMSPLSVSTYLQAESLKFDLVMFDEASQVFPWDAIGAIYRGAQLIVAGDDKQLPPTSFFTRADIESEEDEDDIADFESILSLCKSVNMPNRRLRWHYRSRREPLIAFSNRHFYDGDLVTFPSARDAARDAVQLVYVPEGRWTDRKNLLEARRVAELVVEHYKGKPEKSLGVIAFNMSQQQAIEDAIYDLRRASPVIDVLLKVATHEPLFIKNLENVQGDERDVILLSFGYGKNEAGKFLKNFGPLSKPGGERRLNVAVTRAREAVSLVASVRSADMDLSTSISTGAQLLKAYFEYAEHGVDSLSRSIVETQGACESPFEEEVAAALIRRGLAPVPQVGCGGFRIDLALKHPSHPGLYCLGIECDGATYHSSKTARDRDRIRQSILEGLGWRICRVWSTDWIRNPDAQIQRIVAVYEHAAAQPPDVEAPLLTRTEPEFDDLQPQYTADHESKTPTYVKIDDVPHQQIIDTALRIVTRVGTVDWAELVSLTSRELGFARTGKKIRERIEAILHEQVRRSNLHRSGDRVSIA